MATVVAPTSDAYKPQPSFAWAQGLDTADGYLSLYPQRYQDFWERDRLLDREGPGKIQLLPLLGVKPHLPLRADRRIPPGPVQVARYYDLDVLALANVRYLVSGRELADPRLREISHPGQLPEPLAAGCISPGSTCPSGWVN